MALDERLRTQLLQARTRIIEQLDELEFRVTSSGGARRRGPQDSGDIYDALRNELREIDDLLTPEE